MKKLSNFIVGKRYILFGFTIIVTIISLFLINFVTVNEDITKYLPEDSNMKIGLTIMKNEFPDEIELEGFKLMFKDLSLEEKQKIKESIIKYDAVTSVDCDFESPKYNSNNYTLFIVNTSFDDVDKTDKILDQMIHEYENDYTVYSYYANTNDSMLSFLLPIVFIIFVIILLILCESYVEIILLLASIGFSIVINMGTNIIFHSISDTTLSIAAILQLALSIDYSIMLFRRYDQERKLLEGKNNVQAMTNAIKNAFNSISSSALTTVVGLLVLLFMSFTIGADIGLVLAKGIMCSLFCVFTVMPTMVLWFDKLIQKTNKKNLMSKKKERKEMETKNKKILIKIGNFSYKYRYLISILAVILLITVSVVQSFSNISYSYSDYNKVTEVFPEEDTLVVVYDSKNEEKIEYVLNRLSEDKHITSINSYANTLGKKMNYQTMSSAINMDSNFVKMLYYRYQNDVSNDTMTLSQAINFVPNVLNSFNMENSSYSALITSYQEIINGISQNKTYDSESMALMIGMDSSMVGYLYMSLGTTEMTLDYFVNILLNSGSLDEESTIKLNRLKNIIDIVKNNVLFTASDLSEVLAVDGMTGEVVSILYSMYYANLIDLDSKVISIYDFVNYLNGMINGSLSSIIDETQKKALVESLSMMESGKEHLIGNNYSRMVLTLDYELESNAINNFYDELRILLDDTFEYEYYFVGNSAMSNELSKTFNTEYLLISIITAISIFIVVGITFRKFSIPLLLVSIIECAVFTTTSFMVICNVSMYFIALIIVQCILMGAMVDYGILLTNYYIEVRNEYEIKEAMPEVLHRSIKAIGMSVTILIVVTLICGLIMNGAVSSILITLCIGSSTALMLVLFVLPSLLTVFDKFIIKKAIHPVD